MQIVILGAGAMGGLLGSRLARTSARVLLLDTDARLVAAIRERGLTVEELDGTATVTALAVAAGAQELAEAPDLVLVMVKSGATRAAVAAVLPRCHSGTVFLSLQNGIGHTQVLTDLVGSSRLLLGTTAQGATLVAPGRVRHGGNGPTYLGCLDPSARAGAEQVVDLFRRAGLDTHHSDRIQERIWEKLLINVGINAITALTGVPNGWIAALEPARALAQEAVAEAITVAGRLGIPLDDRQRLQVLAVAEATFSNRSSMLQDLDRGRATEIDGINGAIVRYGQETGVPTPINWVLTQLIKVIELKQAGEAAS